MRYGLDIIEENSSIFGANSISNIEVTDEYLEAEFGDVKDAKFDFEPTMEGAEAIIAYAEENYKALSEEYGMDQLKYYIENGELMPFEEAFGATGFGAKAISFFESIKTKIKTLFAKFMMMLNRFVMSDKDFVKKYESKIMSANIASDFKFKGFKFDDSLINGAKILTNAKTALSSYVSGTINVDNIVAKHKDKKYDEIVSIMRGEALKESELSYSEFSKKLFSKLRSGDESKVELGASDINKSDIVEQIKSAKNDKKAANNAYNEMKKSIENMIKTVRGLSKDAGKEKDKDNSKTMEAYELAIKEMKTVSAILQTVNGALLTAIKQRNRQNKAIAVKIMSGSKAVKESFESDYNNISFI